MLVTSSLIFGLCFWLTVACTAVNLAQIVASNENLQEQSTNADSDVNDVTILDGLDYAPVTCSFLAYTCRGLTPATQRVTQDLAGINSALTDFATDAAQLTPTGDSGSESSVTSSVSSVRIFITPRSTANHSPRVQTSPTPLTKMINSLTTKEEMLAAFG